MDTKKKQAALLKRHIRSNRMTQGEFARALNISPSHLSKIMRGTRELGKGKIFEAARIIGIPMEEFFR